MRAATLLLVLLAGPAASFTEAFDDDRHHWRLDQQWRLGDGLLRAEGLPGQVLVVGADGPELADFKATLRATRVGPEPADYGFGLLYRYDPLRRDGYFVAVGAGSGYGFGRIEGGHFSLLAQGRSAVIQTEGGGPLEIEVRGGRHELRFGGTLVDVYRDDERRAGQFGLIVIDAVKVAFDQLEIEPLGEAATVRQLGPLPPGSAPRVLGRADAEVAAEWRRHRNRRAAAMGEPALPERLDVVDLAVLALLKDYHVQGVLAPATVLAGWLELAPVVALGADGRTARAALEFWLQYASAGQPADGCGGQEDLLAGLSWWDAQRARAAGPTGGRLSVDEGLRQRLEADGKRYERGRDETARAADYGRWASLGDEALALARRLAEQP